MNINEFYAELDKIFAEKKPQEAESFMRKALSAAESEKDLPGIITISNELGGYFRYTSRYDEAVPLYENALKMLRAIGQENTPAHGTTLINFATTYTMMGDPENALRLYGQAAEIFSAPQFAGDFNLATLYNNMSHLCQSMGDLQKAEEYLKKALHILQDLRESEIEIAITYTNLANIYVASDRIDDGEELLKKASDIFQNQSGDKDVHYAAAVSALGELYYRRGDYQAAAAEFEKALKLNIRDYGENTDSSRILQKNLQMCLSKINKGDEA